MPVKLLKSRFVGSFGALAGAQDDMAAEADKLLILWLMYGGGGRPDRTTD